MRVWININERGEWVFSKYKEGEEPPGGDREWLSLTDLDEDLIFFYEKVRKLYKEASAKIDEALGIK